MPDWFGDNRDLGDIEDSLRTTGLSETEVAGIMGENWPRFLDEGFGARG